MTDKEVIKALEVCSSADACLNECPFFNYSADCIKDLTASALEIIKRHQPDTAAENTEQESYECIEETSPADKTTTFVIEAVMEKYHIDFERAQQIVLSSAFPELLEDMPDYVHHYDAEYWAKEITEGRTTKPPESRLIVVGGVYRHFKGGKALVMNIAKHSETGEWLVVYECIGGQNTNHKDGIYARPAKMFLSEVDHEKYPDVKQKYRFEYIRPDIGGGYANA
ncbi:MAG: DUF1653 domain-containing protein [Huintestinicola sp.]